jgi:hypothetical protein
MLVMDSKKQMAERESLAIGSDRFKVIGVAELVGHGMLQIS